MCVFVSGVWRVSGVWESEVRDAKGKVDAKIYGFILQDIILNYVHFQFTPHISIYTYRYLYIDIYKQEQHS